MSSDATGAAMIPITHATPAASSVLTSESSTVERPASRAATSFSEAARVARPKRVHRYSAQRMIAITTTVPDSQNLLDGTAEPSMRTTLVGMIDGSGCCVVPNASSMIACKVRRTPSDDTSFASGDALRSGRNTSSSIAAPIASVKISERTSAGGVDSVKPSSPVLRAQNAKPATIATAPVARLMIPAPR